MRKSVFCTILLATTSAALNIGCAQQQRYKDSQWVRRISYPEQQDFVAPAALRTTKSVQTQYRIYKGQKTLTTQIFTDTRHFSDEARGLHPDAAFPMDFIDARSCDLAPADGISKPNLNLYLFFSRIATIETVQYLPEQRRYVFVGPKAEGCRDALVADDFFVAARAANIGEDPSVTIDPGEDDEKMYVKHFGGTQDTHWGFVTFAADLFLKVGTLEHDNASLEHIHVPLPGFRSEIDLAVRYHHDGKSGGSWHRFWGEPSGRDLYMDQKTSAVAIRVRPGIKTEFIGGTPSTQSNQAARTFVAFLTNHYDMLAARFHVFYRLKQLFVLDTVIKYMVDQGLPFEESWLEYSPIRVRTPRSIPAVTVVRTTETARGKSAIGVYGGIAFDVASSRTPLRLSIARRALKEKPALQDTWEFQSDGETWVACSVRVENPVVIKKKQNFKIAVPTRIPKLEWLWVPKPKPKPKPIPKPISKPMSKPKPKPTYVPTPTSKPKRKMGRCSCSYRSDQAPPTSCDDPRCGPVVPIPFD